jgi:hypothetical protein
MLRLTATTEVALVMTSDYCALLRSRRTPETTDALLYFEAVLNVCTSVSVTADALRGAIADAVSHVNRGCTRDSSGRKKIKGAAGDVPVAISPEHVVQIVVRLGFLRARRDTETTEREVQSEWEAFEPLPEMVYSNHAHFVIQSLGSFFICQAFWFSAPHLGSYCSNLMNGRTELATLLRRTKRKEMVMRELSKKVLRRTVTSLILNARLCLPWPCSHVLAHLVNGALTNQNLGLPLHVLDLETSGDILQLQTASGPLVRLRGQGRV